ncbi:MAG: hypothetical protein K0B09_12980, partial [Bacteroidales bacterium]|nr:hypothetical protein [Bacteroidales bacterium]
PRFAKNGVFLWFYFHTRESSVSASQRIATFSKSPFRKIGAFLFCRKPACWQEGQKVKSQKRLLPAFCPLRH